MPDRQVRRGHVPPGDPTPPAVALGAVTGTSAGQLDRDCRDAYAHLVRSGPRDPRALGGELAWSDDRLDAAVTTLRRLRLVGTDDEGRLDPVRPELAAIAFLDLEREVLADRLASFESARRRIHSLLPVHDATLATATGAGSVSSLADVGTVRSLLRHHAELARDRVRIAHPATLGAEGLERSLDLDLRMLERGVGLHSLLAHTSRQDPGTRHYVDAVASHGAQVRTVAVELPKTIIFDDAAAFLPGVSGPGAVLVTDPAVIAHLVAVFDVAWNGAQPYSSHAVEEDTLGPLHHALLEQMATGRKDEQIARHLGLSVRTCRRHIATIMTELGAASRFHAGLIAARRGWIGSTE